MKKLYTHENRIILFNIRNLLREAGIETVLRNEFAGGGIGDLPAFDTWPELWLEDDGNYERARAILHDIEHGPAGSDWYCRGCQELNHASFQLCWQCGRPMEDNDD